MKVTDFELKVLAVLADKYERWKAQLVHYRWMFAVDVASHVWIDSEAWNRSSNCGANGGSVRGIMMGASMGSILHRMVKKGLVRITEQKDTRYRPEFHITQVGLDALKVRVHA